MRWAEQRDLEDDATLRAVLGEAGMPLDWIDRTRDPAVKTALIEETANARAAGVFGVPTWIVGERLYEGGEGQASRCVW